MSIINSGLTYIKKAQSEKPRWLFDDTKMGRKTGTKPEDI